MSTPEKLPQNDNIIRKSQSRWPSANYFFVYQASTRILVLDIENFIDVRFDSIPYNNKVLLPYSNL